MRLFLLPPFFLLVTLAYGQSLSTKSKKAAEYYREADNYRVRRQFDQAIEFLAAALKKDDEFVEAYAMLGSIFYIKQELNEAEDNYSRAISLRPNSPRSLKSLLALSEIQITLEKYEAAKASLEKYMKLGGMGNPYARLLTSQVNYALTHIEDKLEFDPTPLNDKVNQFAMQYFPSTTADDSILFYTKRDGNGFDDDEDIMVSYRIDEGDWGDPESVSDNINTRLNEGTCSVSADGRTLVFTSCQGRDGYGSCDLYVSYKTGDVWSHPQNMGRGINSSAWESQPSLSADGRKIYFVSNRSGGFGGRDLWMSEKSQDGWSTPKNLGKAINTPFEEVSPFIHPNGETLFFASNGKEGFGGYDIYYTSLDTISSINVGYPINRGTNQMSMVISTNGELARYSETDAIGKSVIMEFEVPESLQLPNSALYIKGKVVDANTKLPLEAEIELIDLATNKVKNRVVSDSLTGDFLSVLTRGDEYAYYTSKTGYVLNTLHISSSINANELIEIELKPIAKGVAMVLSNVFFEHDSYELSGKSRVELSKVADFILNNDVRVEIGGYTDISGSEAYNQTLSENRAKSVYDYLVDKLSIPPNRLTYKGYGEEKSPELQLLSQARRIEFKLL